MRLAVAIVCGVVACFAQRVAAATDEGVASERALREECSAFSQEGMRQCLSDKAGESADNLKQSEEALLKSVTSWDEDAKYVTATKERLALANASFAGYRQAQCEFHASLSGGAAGNSNEIGRLACIAELNNRRAAQLRDAASDLPQR